MTVDDGDVVYRRVRWIKRSIDQKTGEARASSDSFRDSTNPPGPMSVILRSALLQAGRTAESLVPGEGGDALVEFRVGVLRQHGFDVMATPSTEEPAHADVVGEKSMRKVRRLLAELSDWTITGED